MSDDHHNWTHAGGLVFRDDMGERRLLLVRAARPPHHWVLPKGHIEAGETAVQAAVREVREEAGVAAEPVQYVGDLQFRIASGKHVLSAFYLMKFVGEVAAAEDREVIWSTVSEALELTPFANTRDLITAAVK